MFLALTLSVPPLALGVLQSTTEAPAQTVVTFEALYQQAEEDQPFRIASPELLGAWRILGYGYVLHFEEQSFSMFSESSAGAWELDASDLFDLEGTCISTLPDNLQGKSAQAGQRRRLASHPLEAPYWIEKLEQLPPDCTVETDWTPTRVFEAYADTMSKHYAFFEERKFDWPSRVAAATKIVHDDMNELELFKVIETSLIGLGDGHVSFEAEIGDEEYELDTRDPLVFRRLKQAARDASGGPQTESPSEPIELSEDEEEHFERGIKAWSGSIRSGVLRDILGGQAKVAGDEFPYGLLEGNVGYVLIPGMGLDDDDMGLQEQVAFIHETFDELLTDLEGIESLVIDISLNGGGFDVISLAIASHFIDAACAPYSKSPGLYPELSHAIHLEPWTGKRFTGSIYLVSSDLTASAAEIFQLCLKDQPHVILIGARGESAFSDAIPKVLPNGWYLTLSVEVYRDAKGICHEATGIPMDIDHPIFKAKDLNNSHAQAIQSILALARGKH